jgi:hypothetical protein
VPLYLLHRYQTEAAVKEIGGLDYRYQLRGDGQIGPVIVAAAEQKKALKLVLRTLSPEFLTLPEPLLRLLPPRPPGLERTQESFPSATGLSFDPVAAAESAADLTLAGLFNAERAARLLQYHARDAANPTLLGVVIDAALATTRPTRGGAGKTNTGLAALVQDAVYVRTVEALLSLAANGKTSGEVRAVVYAKLRTLRQGAAASSTDVYLSHRIDLFDRDPAKFVPAPPIEAPPGMPIGDEED